MIMVAWLDLAAVLWLFGFGMILAVEVIDGTLRCDREHVVATILATIWVLVL